MSEKTEKLTLESLLTYCADQALLGEDEGHEDPQGNAVAVARDLLTPVARCALAEELLRGIPGVRHVSTIALQMATGAEVAAMGEPKKDLARVGDRGLCVGHHANIGLCGFYAYVPATAEDLAEMLPKPAEVSP